MKKLTSKISTILAFGLLASPFAHSQFVLEGPLAGLYAGIAQGQQEQLNQGQIEYQRQVILQQMMMMANPANAMWAQGTRDAQEEQQLKYQRQVVEQQALQNEMQRRQMLQQRQSQQSQVQQLQSENDLLKKQLAEKNSYKPVAPPPTPKPTKEELQNKQFVQVVQGLQNKTITDQDGIQKFIELANAGYAPAQGFVGSMYFNGSFGVNKDETKAAHYWKLCTAQGNPSCQAKLGWMYQKGLGGLKVDKERAVSLYKKSVAGDDPNGMVLLASAYFSGQDGLTQDPEQGVKLLKSAADKGNHVALFNMARFYAQGLYGFPVDETKSIQLLKEAAQKGSLQAQAILDKLGPKGK